MHLSILSVVTMVLTCGPRLVHGFLSIQCDNMDRYQIQRQHRRLHMTLDNDVRESHNSLLDDTTRRRRLLHKMIAIGIGVALMSPLNEHAYAIEQPRPEDTIWMTGKMPKIPGQKPKDKSDVTGTRKDPNFLRSLSDCKNQCENMTGASSNAGYAKGKEECLSECQDICCTTYQQCTFPIVQRI